MLPSCGTLAKVVITKIMLKLIELLAFQGLSLGCLYTNSSRSLGRLTLLPSQQPQEFFILSSTYTNTVYYSAPGIVDYKDQ